MKTQFNKPQSTPLRLPPRSIGTPTISIEAGLFRRQVSRESLDWAAVQTFLKDKDEARMPTCRVEQSMDRLRLVKAAKGAVIICVLWFQREWSNFGITYSSHVVCCSLVTRWFVRLVETSSRRGNLHCPPCSVGTAVLLLWTVFCCRSARSDGLTRLELQAAAGRTQSTRVSIWMALDYRN